MFILNKKDSLSYYTVEAFSRTGLVRHCFTTKEGGVSSGIYESMNLRINSGDSHENVMRNFDIILGAIGTKKENVVCSNQVHEDIIINVGKEDRGNGILFENKFKSADGLITDEPGVALATFYADCVPLFFLDKKKKVIALSHSGWKGTVMRIGQKTIEKFKNDYHSDPDDILVAIGPSIRVCHFEVGEDVAEKFKAEFGDEVIDYSRQNPSVNLQKSVVKQLLDAGIPEDNITDSKVCTYCDSNLLFSHRKTMGKRGNLAAIMELK